MESNESIEEKKKIGIPGELEGIKELADLFEWDETKVFWYHYAKGDINYIPEHVRDSIRAKIVISPKKQYVDGIDFQHFKETIDMKINDKDKNGNYYTRFCFELWKRADGTYSLGNSKAMYIGQRLTKNNYTGFYLKPDILELVNKWKLYNSCGRRCQLIPDPSKRKNCYLFLIEPELLDNAIFSLMVHNGQIKMIA